MKHIPQCSFPPNPALYLVFFAILPVTPLVHATEYIVDTRNAAAADTNPGTPSQPFKTIGAAVAKVQPGDTVTIKAGIYREAFEIKTSGTADKPIVIQAAPGERVVVTGADLVNGWTKVTDPKGRPIWEKTPWGEWATINNAIDSLDQKRGPQLIVDDVLMRRVGSMTDMKPGTYFYDATQGGAIYLWMLPPIRSTQPEATPKGAAWWDEAVDMTSDDPNRHQIEASVRGTLVRAIGQSYLTIRGLVLRYDTAAAQQPGLEVDYARSKQRLATSHDDTIENCVVEFCHGNGLGCGGVHITVRGCYLRYNGAIGAGGRLRDSLWENDVLEGNDTIGHSPGWEAGGVKFFYTTGLTVRNCCFVNNRGPGLWFDTNNSGNIVEGNFCSANDGAGIMFEVSPAYESLDANAKPIVTASKHDPADEKKDETVIPVLPNIIRNNICVSNNGGSAGGIGIVLQLASDTHVLNNTVVGNGEFGIFIRYHPYDTDGHRCVDNVVLNNLCVDNGFLGGNQIEITPDPVSKPGYVARNRSDYNLFWNNSRWLAHNPATQEPIAYPDAARFAEWGKTEFGNTYSAEEMFKIEGREEHTIQWDPEFVSPFLFDYRLLPGSRAIGAGTPTSEVTDDFLGRKRPTGQPPSIGALEYFSGDDAPPSMPKPEAVQ